MKALRANSLGQTPLAGRCPAACLLVAVEVHHGVNDLLLIICRKTRPDGQCVLMLRAVLGGCEEDAPLSRIREASGSCPLVRYVGRPRLPCMDKQQACMGSCSNLLTIHLLSVPSLLACHAQRSRPSGRLLPWEATHRQTPTTVTVAAASYWRSAVKWSGLVRWPDLAVQRKVWGCACDQLHFSSFESTAFPPTPNVPFYCRTYIRFCSGLFWPR